MHKKINENDPAPDQYIASSIIRFGRLKNYIQEKLLVDYFAIEGNLAMIDGLRLYIKNNLEFLQKCPKIKILDVGPAIGALSTLLTLQALNEFDLLDKSYVYLVDVSANVIDNTQKCDFTFPDSLVNPKLKGKICKKLRESKSLVGSAETLQWQDDKFTIILAGFLFHHLHKTVKPIVAKEIYRVLSPGGFLGVAEEWFKNYDKEYGTIHKDDKIPLAYEAIISFKKLTKLLPKLNVFYTQGTESKKHYYAFGATK